MEETLKIKPIVQYLPSNFNVIKKGKRAYIFPIDHPSELVSNNTMVMTSPVVEVGATYFETENTLYFMEGV
jgi:hypothetical protein